MKAKVLALAQWVLGPLALAAAVALVTAVERGKERGKLFVATEKLAPAERERLEAAPLLAVANAAWRLGNGESARKASRAVLDHLPESAGPARARALLRLGAVDRNPEGQAAIYAAACNADPSLCDRLKEATERETSARLVSPGNRLPLYFVGGHPPILFPTAP